MLLSAGRTASGNGGAVSDAANVRSIIVSVIGNSIYYIQRPFVSLARSTCVGWLVGCYFRRSADAAFVIDLYSSDLSQSECFVVVVVVTLFFVIAITRNELRMY